jgi:ribonuclease P protein component
LDFSYNKEERLLNRTDFEALLLNGKVHFTYPFRVVWQRTEKEQAFPVKVAFTVPKKKYKRANKRNLLKRRMREAFRLNKHILYPFLENKDHPILLLIIYIGSDILPYHDIEKKTISVFKHIMDQIQKNA